MGTIDRPEGQSMDMSAKILQELQSLSGRMSKIEDRVNNQQQPAPAVASPARSHTSNNTSDPDPDLMIPMMDALKKSTTIQAAVDNRLKELSTLADKGKFKSQMGGSETVWVKHEIPWPHNHVLSGSNKNLLRCFVLKSVGGRFFMYYKGGKRPQFKELHVGIHD